MPASYAPIGPIPFLTSAAYPLGPVEVGAPPPPAQPPAQVGPIRLAPDATPRCDAAQLAVWDRLLRCVTKGDRGTLRQLLRQAVVELDESRLLQYTQQALMSHGHNEQQYEASLPRSNRRLHASTLSQHDSATVRGWMARLAPPPSEDLWPPLLDHAVSLGLIPLSETTDVPPVPEETEMEVLRRHMGARGSRHSMRMIARSVEAVQHDVTLWDWPVRAEALATWARAASEAELIPVLEHVQTPQVRQIVLSQVRHLTPALIDAALRHPGYGKALMAHPDLAQEPLATHLGLNVIAAHAWHYQATPFDYESDRFIPLPRPEENDRLDTEALWVLERLAYRPQGLPVAVRQRLVTALEAALPTDDQLTTNRYTTLAEARTQTRREMTSTWAYQALVPDPQCPTHWVEAVRGQSSYQTPSQPRSLLRRMANPHLSPEEFERGRRLFELGIGYSPGLNLPDDGFWQPWQLAAFIKGFTEKTDIDLYRRVAARSELDEAGAAIVLQRVDDEAVRDALAKNPVARRLPVVRAALGRCRVPAVLSGLVESATPEEFENLWPRLTKTDPEAAMKILRDRRLPEGIALHPQHLRPLLISKIQPVREQAIRLMGELELDPTAQRPKARSPRQALKVAASATTPVIPSSPTAQQAGLFADDLVGTGMQPLSPPAPDAASPASGLPAEGLTRTRLSR